MSADGVERAVPSRHSLRYRTGRTGLVLPIRFELYIAGIEIANAFHELNDPDEQRRRHRADQEARRAAVAPVPPLDEAFLGALESATAPTVPNRRL